MKVSLQIAFLTLLLCLSPKRLLAQSETKIHPVDKKYEACRALDYSNLGERACLRQALEDWDKALNKAYKSITFSPTLKASQLAWLAYRDKEFKHIENLFNAEGSMYPNLILVYKIEIVKARVLQLERYVAYQATTE